MDKKIIEILHALRPEFDFSASSDFIGDGMLDSFDVVSLVTELEDNFGIAIDGEDIVPSNFSSVATIKMLIDKSERN